MTKKFVPYGRQLIDEADVDAVVRVLRSDWLTTGPVVGQFEDAFAEYVGAKHAVAVSNGTAALHLCMLANRIGPGDEVIVPALTFIATANCVRYVGAKVVFADVLPDTLTMDPSHVESLITSDTRAIITVDYAGLPADLTELMCIADEHGLVLVEDACHALGAEHSERRVGAISHMSTFSFHPVKHMTTAEGGMVTTEDPELAQRVRRLRNHGIDSDHRQREQEGTWLYDMTELGFNYRLSDVQCALGLSQLPRVPKWLTRRREVAQRYDDAFNTISWLSLPVEPEGKRHAWHLYAVRVIGDNPKERRRELFETMRASGIGANVHYYPVYLHSYYRSLGYSAGQCPIAERAYDSLLSLPMWHALADEDQERVVDSVLSMKDNYGS